MALTGFHHWQRVTTEVTPPDTKPYRTDWGPFVTVNRPLNGARDSFNGTRGNKQNADHTWSSDQLIENPGNLETGAVVVVGRGWQGATNDGKSLDPTTTRSSAGAYTDHETTFEFDYGFLIRESATSLKLVFLAKNTGTNGNHTQSVWRVAEAKKTSISGNTYSYADVSLGDTIDEWQYVSPQPSAGTLSASTAGHFKAQNVSGDHQLTAGLYIHRLSQDGTFVDAYRINHVAATASTPEKHQLIRCTAFIDDAKDQLPVIANRNQMSVGDVGTISTAATSTEGAIGYLASNDTYYLKGNSGGSNTPGSTGWTAVADVQDLTNLGQSNRSNIPSVVRFDVDRKAVKAKIRYSEIYIRHDAYDDQGNHYSYTSAGVPASTAATGAGGQVVLENRRVSATRGVGEAYETKLTFANNNVVKISPSDLEPYADADFAYSGEGTFWVSYNI